MIPNKNHPYNTSAGDGQERPFSPLTLRVEASTTANTAVNEVKPQSLPAHDGPTGFNPAIYQILPEPLRQILGFVEDQHRKDILLSGLLGSVSSCLPNVGGFSGNPSRFYKPNLYVAVVGSAASGKGILSVARKLLQPIDEMLREQESEISFGKGQEKHNRQERPSLFISGNVSAAALFEQLTANNGQGIIFEEEIDVLNSVMKNEWGSLSELLRKAWEHETLSYLRKGGVELYIKEPSISLVLSGTPQQLIRLIPSAEDGLFSRFAFLVTTAIESWKSKKPGQNSVKLNETVDEAGKHLRILFSLLSSRNAPIQFDLNPLQWKQHDELFEQIHDTLDDDSHAAGFSSTVRRSGVIAFRIAMILALLRTWEAKTVDLTTVESITANDEDVGAALSITHTLVNHSLFIATQLPIPTKTLSVGAMDPFYEALPKSFSKPQAVEVGKQFSLSVRTVTYRLTKYLTTNRLQSPKKGYYNKLT